MRSWLIFKLPILAALHLSCGVSAASLVDGIINAMTNATDCHSCHELFAVMKGVAHLGDSVFVDTWTTVCKALGTTDDDICEGEIARTGPILAHDYRSISPFGNTATKLCESYFGLCQPPPVNKFKFPLPVAPAYPKKWTSKGRKTFQVTHFSDVHTDMEYTPGAEANCTKTICCKNYADQAGKPVTQPAGLLADPRCDSSDDLTVSMLRAVSMQESSFSIFTGDVISHRTWLVTKQGVTSRLQQFNQEMKSLINHTVFPTIGNHDNSPSHNFPRNTTPEASSQWVFDTQAAGWSEWLGPSADESIQHMSGSYSMVVHRTNLRIISLNNIYWYKVNAWLFDSDSPQPDPNGILTFLAQQLQAAEDAGQRAWLIAHVPPSSQDALHDQSNYFNQIVRRYNNTIAGQYYGHTHNDEFAVSYRDYENRVAENAMGTMVVGPALTPTSGNPAFKVYDVDPDTYEIMDSRVFITNMSDPNFQTSPQWEQYYSAREVYGPMISGGWPASEPLTPEFWHKVTEAFEQNDEYFQKFVDHKSRGFNVQTCAPGQCKDNAICVLRAGRAQDNCYIATPQVRFGRREFGENTGQAIDHCGGQDAAIFSQLPSKMAGADIKKLRQMMTQAVPELAQ